MSALGDLKSAKVVETAVAERLRAWMPAYIAEVERQDGRRVGNLPALRSIKAVSEHERFPENQLPAAVVVSTGTVGDPIKEADGYYRATYSVGIAVVVSAKEEQGSREIAELYGAAVRGCLVQRRSLSDTVEVGNWLGESFDELDAEDRRTLFGGVNLFEMELRNIVSWKKGPPPSWVTPETPVEADPPADPTDEITGGHTATSVDVDVDVT